MSDLIPDEEREAAIEAVAQVMFEPPSLGQVDDPEYTWAQMVVEDPTRADMYRQDAAAALEAVARTSQPVQVEVTDEMVKAASESLGIHRWKSMGVSSVECECGEIVKGADDLTGFPADVAFRNHLARAALSAALGGGNRG